MQGLNTGYAPEVFPALMQAVRDEEYTKAQAYLMIIAEHVAKAAQFMEHTVQELVLRGDPSLPLSPPPPPSPKVWATTVMMGRVTSFGPHISNLFCYFTAPVSIHRHGSRRI
jgi:hypothetical protein